MDNGKKLILLDGCSILFRAYHAVPPKVTENGHHTGALHGFIMSLYSLVKNLTVDGESISMAVALDSSRENNFRCDIYSEYKNNRPKAADDLVYQLKLFKPMLEAFGIIHLSDLYCEADDIIAAYTKQGALEGYDVTIVSSDKDLMQLVSEKVRFFDIYTKRFFSADDVYAKFMVHPHQLGDFLAMVGDRVDNIPGIKGIGPKIASSLLERFGTIEGIYRNINNLSETRVRKMLISGYEDAILSKKLVELKSDITLPHKIEEMAWSGFKGYHETIGEFLTKYSMTSLTRLFKL